LVSSQLYYHAQEEASVHSAQIGTIGKYVGMYVEVDVVNVVI